MNKVLFTGRTGADCELRYTAGNGKAVVNFNLAVNRGFGDNKKTEWWKCVVWEKTAESMAQHVGKGSLILIEGELTQREWEDREGANRREVEVQVRQVEYLVLKAPGGGEQMREPGEDDF